MMDTPTYYTLVSPLIEAYSEAHTTQETELLSRLNRDTHLRTHMPQMLSGHLQGAFLSMISRMIKPFRILEIGTFTGYSAICLAAGLPEDGLLETIDVNPEMQDFAGKYFSEAGLTHKIRMYSGDAGSIVPSLEGPYDLVFIDADKENYSLYFDLVLPKMNPGGWILADNTLWYGKVIDPNASEDQEAASIVAFNNHVQNHPGVENLLVPIRDGLMIIRKR